MLLGAGGGILGGAGLPKWLGWLALVVGVACFIPYVGFLGFIASTLWIVLTSVVLFRGPKRTEGTTDAVSTAD